MGAGNLATKNKETEKPNREAVKNSMRGYRPMPG